MPAAAAPPDFAALRSDEFPGVGRSPYFNAASVTPLPERTRRALEAYTARRASAHDLGNEDFEPTLARCRAEAARLIGADGDEIALGPNTSFGINLAAHCLPLERGSTVVVSDREFPANVYPWMRLKGDGIRFERVPTDALGRPHEERILERLDQGGVGAFALSAVQFADGYRADLVRFGSFCRERGIAFVVDAIQALGQLPIDVHAAQIDVLATGAQKWLCGPFGTGFAYVRRGLHEQMQPRAVGWTSLRASQDFAALLDYRWDFVAGARRFEVATQPFGGFAGLTESLRLLRDVGVESIAAHIAEVLRPVREWAEEHPSVRVVSDLAPRHASGIFAFRPPDPQAAFAALAGAGVVCVLREGAIRLSPHLYNTVEEMQQTVAVLQRTVG